MHHWYHLMSWGSHAAAMGMGVVWLVAWEAHLAYLPHLQEAMLPPLEEAMLGSVVAEVVVGVAAAAAAPLVECCHLDLSLPPAIPSISSMQAVAARPAAQLPGTSTTPTPTRCSPASHPFSTRHSPPWACQSRPGPRPQLGQKGLPVPAPGPLTC